ncbi:hypothetical protein K458DRAFT_423561, partial [Lentithecium fluviatile CBS 122367]
MGFNVLERVWAWVLIEMKMLGWSLLSVVKISVNALQLWTWVAQSRFVYNTFVWRESENGVEAKRGYHG